MWIGSCDGRTTGDVGDVLAGSRAGRGCTFLGLSRGRQPAGFVALGQHFDGEVWAVAFAQAATDAVRGLDDGVVSQDEAVLGTDLDADIAAFAPLIDPPDVDVVDDGGG
jgi:hypothetical protein